MAPNPPGDHGDAKPVCGGGKIAKKHTHTHQCPECSYSAHYYRDLMVHIGEAHQSEYAPRPV